MGLKYGMVRHVMTLGELGKHSGDLYYTAISMGIKRLMVRSQHDRTLRLAMKRVSKQCE